MVAHEAGDAATARRGDRAMHGREESDSGAEATRHANQFDFVARKRSDFTLWSLAICIVVVETVI